MPKKEGPGFIYIFWNPQWTKGLVRRSPYSKYYKVGETSRNPEDRLREYRTYSPFETIEKFSIEVSKRIIAEKAIHLLLRSWQVYEAGGGREFFKRRFTKIKNLVCEVVAEVNSGIIIRRGDGTILRRGYPIPGQ